MSHQIISTSMSNNKCWVSRFFFFYFFSNTIAIVFHKINSDTYSNRNTIIVVILI